MNKFKHELLDVKDGEIIKIGEKILYNCDGVRQADYILKNIKKKYKFDKRILKMRSALKISNSLGNQYNNAIGYINNNGTNTMAGQKFVFFHSHPAGVGCHPTFPENFDNTMSYFAVRKMIKSNWHNQTGPFILPSEEILRSDSFKEFENDCIIYALFQGDNVACSLKNIPYLPIKNNN